MSSQIEAQLRALIAQAEVDSGMEVQIFREIEYRYGEVAAARARFLQEFGWLLNGRPAAVDRTASAEAVEAANWHRLRQGIQ